MLSQTLATFWVRLLYYWELSAGMMMDRIQRRNSGITIRAVAIGFILIIANSYWLTITSELMVPQCLLTFVSLFFNAVLSLFVLVVINLLLRKFTLRHAFSAQELLVIYVMVVMVSTIGGHTIMCFLIGTLAHPFRFASPENEWADLFWRYIPSWFIPSQNVLDEYFDGESTFYTMRNIRGWLTPILVWSGFITAIWFVLICINSIIRAPWTEKEKLAYPIIQLPLRMTTESSSFFRNRGMWIGFGVAGFFEVLAGLHYIFPKVPAVQLNYYSVNHLFTGRPWSSVGWLPLSAYPFIIGLTFFVPLDISLSAWFFYLIVKVERIIRTGIMGTGDLYLRERAGGAWLAVGILALWGTRNHLYQVWRQLWGRASIDDSNEPMRYRSAVIGIIIGLGCLTLFSYKAGMPVWISFGFIAIYLIMSLGVSRVRAEFGPPAHEILALDPGRFLYVGIGSRRLGAPGMTVLSFYYWLNRLYVAHPMPNQLEAFKLAERAKINNKRLIWVMMFATVIGALASFWSYLHVMYRTGASASSGYIVGIGREVFTRLQIGLSTLTGIDQPAAQATGLGFVITSILYFLRHRFFWWPFHPIGYVMTVAPAGGLADFWFSVFLGWLIKTIIMKFFGLGAHRRAVPFFLGLVLGDYVVSSLWSLVGTIFRIPTYVLWSP